MTTFDPTAIDLRTDPTHQRFRGVTVHGNVSFDVPFISEIADNLWLGGCENGLVLPRHIEHVVSLYPWEAYKKHHELKSLLSVSMYDSREEPNSEQIIAIARWINTCRKTGPVLVHCQAGLNRSSLVAATALILDGMSPNAAITLLREQRSSAVLCNPTFEGWVRGFQP